MTLQTGVRVLSVRTRGHEPCSFRVTLSAERRDICPQEVTCRGRMDTVTDQTLSLVKDFVPKRILHGRCCLRVTLQAQFGYVKS